MAQKGLRSSTGRGSRPGAFYINLKEVADWIEHYRRFWSEQLASLDAFVTSRKPRATEETP